MKVSDEMVESFYNDIGFEPSKEDIRDALEAALAPYEAPPFALDAEGARALDNHFMAPELRMEFLESELRRACKTLGVAQAPVGDLLTACEQRSLSKAALHIELTSEEAAAIAAALDRLAPKPAPAVSPLRAAFDEYRESDCDWTDFERICLKHGLKGDLP